MKYKDIISKMTTEEKSSLMSGKDFWQTRDIEKYSIPSMFLADGPHGIRKQKAAADHLGLNPSINATCFPTAATMANSFDIKLIEKLGGYLGKEAKSQKVNVLLGPGTNIKRNPLCGRNFEYFSEDPYLAGKMAASYIKGVQSSGVSACVKHFAVNNQEYRRLVIDSVLDERALREIYLTPFEMAIKEGQVKTIMSSYNKVNGSYANENLHLMKDILRGEWGYTGVVVTDWGGSNDRVSGLLAGNELEMPTTDGETNREIVAAIKAGKISEDVLDECVDRLLCLIFETNQALNEETISIDFEEHHKLAQTVAESSIVLLKNEDNLLPLKQGTRVAIIGDFAENPRYQGAGSSTVNPTQLHNTLEFINEYDCKYIGFEKGFNRYGQKSNKLIQKAKKLAEKADVILLYLGLDEVTEAEGLDRKHMKIPNNQALLVSELAKMNKNIVVVLSCGSAIELNFTDNVSAIVHGYLNGQSGAKALLNVIFGHVNPSGRLSESLPFNYADSPSSSYFPGTENTAEYRESIYVGYRYYEKTNTKVRYPFGFGLSYTTFQYSDLVVDDCSVSFTIKNIGEYDGAEVPQLYIGLKESKIFRPAKELKGFQKIYLKKGASEKVVFYFDNYSFRYWNIKTNQYEIEEGTYQILIGSSSDHIHLHGEIDIKGTSDIVPYSQELLPSYYSGDIKNIELNEFESLLGHKAPDSKTTFYKKNRLIVGYNTTVAELRYSKGFSGRLFAGAIHIGIKFLNLIGKRTQANTLVMGVLHQPMRALSRMTAGMISFPQLDGLIKMFNGQFFLGLIIFFKQGKEKKRFRKTEKQRVEQTKL